MTGRGSPPPFGRPALTTSAASAKNNLLAAAAHALALAVHAGNSCYRSSALDAAAVHARDSNALSCLDAVHLGGRQLDRRRQGGGGHEAERQCRNQDRLHVSLLPGVAADVSDLS